MPKPLRIGFVLTHPVEDYFPDWEQVVHWEHFLDVFALGLSRRGHTCIKYIPSPLVETVKTYVHDSGHLIRRVPTTSPVLRHDLFKRERWNTVGFTINLRSVLNRDHIDIVYYANYYTSFFVPCAWIARDRPVIAEFAGGELPKRNTVERLFWQALLTYSMRRCSGFLLPDYPYERQVLQERFRIPDHRLYAFEMLPVDDQTFFERDREACRHLLGWSLDAVHLLALTRIPVEHMNPNEKNPFLLVRQFAALHRIAPGPVHLHIAGWGPGFEALSILVRQLGLASYVHLHGYVDHRATAMYLNASDAMFMPFMYRDKLNEGLALYESFFCGTPTIGWKRKPSLATEQLGGFLVDPDLVGGANMLRERVFNRQYLRAKGVEGKGSAAPKMLSTVSERLERICLELRCDHSTDSRG